MKHPLTTLYPAHIENIPVFHFYPGLKTLIIGTKGCTLDCRYCMNQYLLNEEVLDYELSAGQIVDKAGLVGCQAISFTANEPAVSFEYFMDIAAVAQEKGIRIGCSSNGLFSRSQIKSLLESIDFINVGLKGPDKDFYQSYCGGGDPVQVLDCISSLKQTGIHVEVTTPFVPSLGLDDMTGMAKEIAGIDPEIAWHVFRLLPEYKLTHMPKTEIRTMIELKNRVQNLLPYIYLVNFPGSQWIDTWCPYCGTLLIERFSKGMGGASLLKVYGDDHICPKCQRPYPLKGTVSQASEEIPPKTDPRTGYFDVGGWQAKVNMSDGRTLESSWIKSLHNSLPVNPYPGDMTFEAEKWVTDEALSMVDRYSPDLLVMVYAQSAFVARHRQEDSHYQDFVFTVGREVERFLGKTGYSYAVIGLGDLIPTRGYINLEKGNSGVASAEEGLARLYRALPEDADRMASLAGVQAIYSKQDFEDTFACQLPEDLPGQYVIIPENGYLFLTMTGAPRLPFRTESQDSSLPYCSSFNLPGSLNKIRDSISFRVKNGEKIALILLDGIGQKRFPFHGWSLNNTINGLPYTSSPLQYAVISTGQDFFADYMAAPKWNRSRIRNPFALQGVYLTSCMTHDVMQAGKAAVSLGNRSILTHSMFPANISTECHCAALHHFGTFTVIA